MNLMIENYKKIAERISAAFKRGTDIKNEVIVALDEAYQEGYNNGHSAANFELGQKLASLLDKA